MRDLIPVLIRSSLLSKNSSGLSSFIRPYWGQIGIKNSSSQRPSQALLTKFTNSESARFVPGPIRDTGAEEYQSLNPWWHFQILAAARQASWCGQSRENLTVHTEHSYLALPVQ